MLRIAVYYQNMGRNDGNPLFTSSCLKRAQYFCDAKHGRNENKSLINYFPGGRLVDPGAEMAANYIMENIDPEGVYIERISPHPGNMRPYGHFDYHLWVDWGEDGLKGVLPYEPQWPEGKVIYWASDTHLGFNYRLECAIRSHMVFCAQNKAVKAFRLRGINAHWLPHAFEPLAYPKFNLASRRYDICFVGHVNSDNRIDMLDRAFKKFPNFFFGQRQFEKAAEKYAQSRVNLNIAMNNDINMRCFEVMGSGNFLLTDNIIDIETLFENGKHLVLYHSLDEMVEKAGYYIKHNNKREAIAKNGYEECLAKHTIAHRVLKIMQAIKQDKETKHVVHA